MVLGSVQTVLIKLGIDFPSVFSTQSVVDFFQTTQLWCPETLLLEPPASLLQTSNMQQCFGLYLFWTPAASSVVSPPMNSIFFDVSLLLDLSTKMFACAGDFCKSLAATSAFFSISLSILSRAHAVIFPGWPRPGTVATGLNFLHVETVCLAVDVKAFRDHLQPFLACEP